jgi:hypothetical protein
MGDPLVEIREYGPIFDGSIYGQMRKALDDIERALARETVKEVQAVDRRTFKHPTGHATSMVGVEESKSEMRVNRGHLVYAPWLEDGGSRSDIFSGYHAFEKSKREVDQRVMDIADPIVEGYLIR